MSLVPKLRALLPGQRSIALLFFVFCAGCAQVGGSVEEEPRIAIAADRDALTDKFDEASDPAADSAVGSDDALTEEQSLALSLVPVPLEGAVRRLVPDALEAAALQSADSAGPRAAVVVPASISGLQPPNLGEAATTSIAQVQAVTAFPGLRFIGNDPRLLGQADWALLMNVHLGLNGPGLPVSDVGQSPAQDSHLCVRVLDLNAGKVLAARRQVIDFGSINRVPTRYFRDLPVVLPWQSLFGGEVPCSTEASDPRLQRESVDWRARLAVEMHFDRATTLYGERDHYQAREAFRELEKAIRAAEIASSLAGGQQARLHARLGEYLATWRMVFNRGAEGLLRPLVEALFDDQQEVSLNLALSPVDAAIVAGRRMKSRQTEWLIETSRLLRRKRWCADIIGFATDDFRSGQSGGEPLALQHANYVRDQLRRHSAFRQTALLSYAAGTGGKIPVALTGDVRDEWARRVSIRLVDCRRPASGR